MRSILLTTLLTAAAALAQDAGPGRGPPAEAKAACSGQSEGTACGFTFDGKNLVGTCRTGPRGEAVACLPEGGPGKGKGGGHHGPPPEATAACASQSVGASCSFTHHDHTLTGTCRTGPDGSGTLACAPSVPPPQQ